MNKSIHIPLDIQEKIEKYLLDMWRCEHALMFANCLLDLSMKLKFCTSYRHLSRTEKALFKLP